jgi:hypothetical protein
MSGRIRGFRIFDRVPSHRNYRRRELICASLAAAGASFGGFAFQQYWPARKELRGPGGAPESIFNLFRGRVPIPITIVRDLFRRLGESYLPRNRMPAFRLRLLGQFVVELPLTLPTKKRRRHAGAATDRAEPAQPRRRRPNRRRGSCFMRRRIEVR